MVKTLAMAHATEEGQDVDPEMIEQIALDLIELPDEVLVLLGECISGNIDSCVEIGERYQDVNNDDGDGN